MSKCREFKVGDKVIRLTPNLDLEVGGVYEVKSVNYGWIGLFGEGHTNYDASYFKLVDERQALSDAIALVQKYKIGVSVSTITVWSQGVFGSSHNVTIRQLLDKLFPPTPTAQELEIARIETEMRALADSLAKLKS